jgi:hypothetical protein
MMRLAIKFSDGLVVSNEEKHASLIAYAKELGIPVAIRTEETPFEDTYNNMYDAIVEE